MVQRIRFVLPVAVLAAVALTGCAPFPFACSTIGYSSVATITLAEAATGVTLELCDGQGCAPGSPMEPQRVDPLGASPAPVVETGVFELAGDSSTSWTASLGTGQPVLGYRLTDASGAVIAEGEADVEWVRVGGSDQCGGPREAEIVLPLS